MALFFILHHGYIFLSILTLAGHWRSNLHQRRTNYVYRLDTSSVKPHSSILAPEFVDKNTRMQNSIDEKIDKNSDRRFLSVSIISTFISKW